MSTVIMRQLARLEVKSGNRPADEPEIDQEFRAIVAELCAVQDPKNGYCNPDKQYLRAHVESLFAGRPAQAPRANVC